jgi:hypothetical protein
MSNISVTGYPRVKVRCQFETIPGVSYIHLEFDPHSRGNQVAGKVETAYGDFPLDDQVINGCIGEKTACGSLFILKKSVFIEVADAVEKGMQVLRDMVKASGYKSCGF